MYCPACGSACPEGASFCVQCGQTVATYVEAGPIGMAQSGTPVPVPVSEVQRTLRVAQNFRYLLLSVGVYLLIQFGMRFMLLAAARTLGPQLLGLISMVVILVGLASWIAMVIFSYRVVSAMGSSVAILWVIGMAIPCVGLIVLAALSSKATSWLSARGVKVGLLGPSPATIEQLRSTVLNA